MSHVYTLESRITTSTLRLSVFDCQNCEIGFYFNIIISRERERRRKKKKTQPKTTVTWRRLCWTTLQDPALPSRKLGARDNSLNRFSFRYHVPHPNTCSNFVTPCAGLHLVWPVSSFFCFVAVVFKTPPPMMLSLGQRWT